MCQRHQPPLLYATRIDIPLEIRSYLITLFNQTPQHFAEGKRGIGRAIWHHGSKSNSQGGTSIHCGCLGDGAVHRQRA